LIVMITMLAPKMVVMLHLVVLMNLMINPTVMTTALALMILVSLKLDASLYLLFVTTIMLVLLILAILLWAATTNPLIVMITTNVLKTHVMNLVVVSMKPFLAMITMLVPLTAVILKKDVLTLLYNVTPDLNASLTLVILR
jgi:hypothetical protein